MKLSKIKKLTLASKIIKGLALIATSSAAMADANNYLIMVIAMIGGTADIIISFIKEQENKKLQK